MKNNRCSEGTSNFRDFVEIFDKNYNKVLNDSECQLSYFAYDPKSCLALIIFSLNDLATAINKVELGKCFYYINSLHLKYC